MLLFRTAATFTLLCSVADCADLLPAVKPCPRSGPDISACLLQTARDAVPYFAAGDEKRRINPIEPQRIPYVEAQQGSGSNFFKASGSDGAIHGWKDMNITDAGVDLSKRQAFFHLFVPRLNSTAKYEMTGNILYIPVYGKGVFSGVIHDVYLNLTIDFDVEKKAFKKEPPTDYIVLKDLKFGLTIAKGDLHLSNLFNGNKLLGRPLKTTAGDTTNDFINANFQETFQELLPSVEQTLQYFVTQGFASVQQYLPYNELFPE